MLNVLVTGGYGFIGSEIVRQLHNTGLCDKIVVTTSKGAYSVTSCLPVDDRDGVEKHRCDISCATHVRSLFSYHPDIDVIIHCAAVPVIKKDAFTPTAITNVNVLGTHNLLEYAPKGSHFTFLSSAAVYGDGFGDDTLGDFHTYVPTSVYGWTKLACEQLIRVYNSKVKPLIVRPIANVGRGATHGVVKAFVEQLSADPTRLELLGDCPGSCKPYMHVEDTVRAIIALTLDQKLGVYNIGHHGGVTVEQLAKDVMIGMGIEPSTVAMQWQGESSVWEGDNKRVCITDAKIKRVLSFRYNISEAIQIAAMELKKEMSAS